MDKFQEIYRIETARLSKWNYGSNAHYFITICTFGREHFFGEIEQNEMVFNDVGKIAQNIWNEIPNQFKYVVLGSFVVMPNHIHGIIKINKTDSDVCDGRDAINRVSTNETEPIKKGGITGKHNPMLHQNLSRILRWYKGRVTFESHQINPVFEWQSRFHDHIIRDEQELYAISTYIKNNPKNWTDDEFYLNDLQN